MSSPPAAAHVLPVRVYYEDTDAGGVVYHANYLKFAERGRSEWVREIGLDQKRLKAEEGIVLVVRRLEADYLRPAFYDDALVVTTGVERRGGASLTLWQEVLREGAAIFTARVVIVAMGADGRPVRLPGLLRDLPLS